MFRASELFRYWVTERERIRFLKDELRFPRPWSQDPIFQTVYFCNVQREKDRVTRWLRTHWLKDDPNYNFAMVMARLINKPETLEIIGFPYAHNEMDIERELTVAHEICKRQGRPFWGNAYVVTTHGQRMGKLQYAIGLLIGAQQHLAATTLPGTLAGAHAALKTLEGFSDFMAAQVVADLKNTPFHPLAKAEDWWTFAAPGPGSLRGLAWYFGKKPYSPRKFMEGLNSIRSETPEWHMIHRICNQDLQNCLCEFDKYMRVSTGTGRSKRKYNGGP
jgi:hypothetical protein